MTDLYVHNNYYNIKDSHKEYTIGNYEKEPDSNDEQCMRQLCVSVTTQLSS